MGRFQRFEWQAARPSAASNTWSIRGTWNGERNGHTSTSSRHSQATLRQPGTDPRIGSPSRTCRTGTIRKTLRHSHIGSHAGSYTKGLGSQSCSHCAEAPSDTHAQATCARCVEQTIYMSGSGTEMGGRRALWHIVHHHKPVPPPVSSECPLKQTFLRNGHSEMSIKSNSEERHIEPCAEIVAERF